MKRLTACLLLALTLAIVSQAGATNYIDSQVVCQVLPGADPDTVAATVGALVTGGVETVNLYLMTYRSPMPVDTVVALLRECDDVADAQPNYLIKILQDQVSQPFVDQVSQPFVDGVSPEPYYDQYPARNMSIDSTSMIHQGEGQTIAIIDGGLDNRHPLFTNRLDPSSIDLIDSDYEPWVYDGLSANHGTFVAGIAARSAGAAQLMIIRAFGATGVSSSFDIAASICYAAENGADVINMSFGMDDYDAAVVNAVNYAYSMYGVIMTAAAGNSDREFDRFPACHPYVMSIAAVDSNDIKADFSNYSISVNASACGVDIYSSLCGGDVWGWWCGTSFSTPFASGLAALVKSLYPEAPPEFIVNRILASTDDIDPINTFYSGMLGNGRLNFIKAAYMEGDANGSGSINLGDVVFIVNYIFRDGPAPIPPEAGDANCDSEISVGDAVYLVNFVFRSGPVPGCD